MPIMCYTTDERGRAAIAHMQHENEILSGFSADIINQGKREPGVWLITRPMNYDVGHTATGPKTSVSEQGKHTEPVKDKPKDK